ncbi:L7Ae/L30e/S12e/Gadd45 family ribosomal protein [Desulfofalx alkaliphila]|uniref:L7Ae/L30e/S12e/Gadd45 family ribosomal protein n=1 Tax=Desulfofalx alkaliphila TaxID=105483 RepID=UPI0004E0C515|nr:ribosomal L7Ae/L30e/S12e/Gadd45 family protein [Desulfofalx alkaliphila]
MNKKAVNLLGLCQRAGKLLTGDYQVKSAIKSGRALLVLLATDASQRTKKEYLYMGKANKVPVIETGTKAEYGVLAGKTPRAALAVIDNNFAKGISEVIVRGEA